MAHIRRYDYFANILQTVVEILGFYHPAVWWVSNRIRIERENCCDDLAVSICGSSLQYARALTSMEEMRHSRTDLAMAASGGSLMARIARLLGRPAVDDRRFAWLPGLIALLLVAGILIPPALVFAAPDATPALPPVAESNGVRLTPAEANAPNDSGQTVTMAQPEDGTESQDKAYVLVDFTIARALFDAPLDQETMLLIVNILAAERPQIAGADPKSKLTLGEVLKTYVTRQSLSQETGQALLELLQTRGFVNILSRPKVTTTDGDQARVRIGYEQPIVPPSQGSDTVDANAIERIECGTSIYMTTHVEQNKYVTLDMTVRMADPVPQEQSSDLPIIRTMEIASTVTVPDNRCFWLLVEPGGDPNAPDRDPESMLVVFRPSIVRSASVPADEAAAQTPQSDKRPRQVLLDARVVAMEGGDLPNVGVEWAHPTMQQGQLDNAADWFSRIGIGYSPDRVFTDALMARLSQLEASNHARLISNPQVVAQDGHRARLRSVQEEWFLISDPGTDSPSELQRIESGTALSVTPRIDEKDQITLDIEFEVSNTLPRHPDDNLPIVTRRMAKNAVTIKDGGTVAIAGLGKSPFGQSSQPARGNRDLRDGHAHFGGRAGNPTRFTSSQNRWILRGRSPLGPHRTTAGHGREARVCGLGPAGSGVVGEHRHDGTRPHCLPADACSRPPNRSEKQGPSDGVSEQTAGAAHRIGAGVRQMCRPASDRGQRDWCLVTATDKTSTIKHHDHVRRRRPHRCIDADQQAFRRQTRHRRHSQAAADHDRVGRCVCRRGDSAGPQGHLVRLHAIGRG